MKTAESVEVLEDILECVCDAIVKLEEARGIAETEWGKKHPRTKNLEDVWAEAYSLRQWAMESIRASKRARTKAEDNPGAEKSANA